MEITILVISLIALAVVCRFDSLSKRRTYVKTMADK